MKPPMRATTGDAPHYEFEGGVSPGTPWIKDDGKVVLSPPNIPLPISEHCPQKDKCMLLRKKTTEPPNSEFHSPNTMSTSILLHSLLSLFITLYLYLIRIIIQNRSDVSKL